jgi:hypothetical protein
LTDQQKDPSLIARRHSVKRLILSLLPENGERPFAVLARKVIKAEMKTRTPSQATCSRRYAA